MYRIPLCYGSEPGGHYTSCEYVLPGNQDKA